MTATLDSPQHQTPAASNLRAKLVNALDGHTQYSRDCHLSGEFLTGEIWPIITRALAASPPQAETPGLDREVVALTVPDGWALMPTTPTDEMLDAFDNAAINAAGGSINSRLIRLYKAGLSEIASLAPAEWIIPAYEALFASAPAAPILAATAVSQLPTSRQDAGGAIEALKAIKETASLHSQRPYDGYGSILSRADAAINAALDSTPAAGGAERAQVKAFKEKALETIQNLRHAAACNFTPAYSGGLGEARLNSLFEAYKAVDDLPLPAAPTQTARDGGE